MIEMFSTVRLKDGREGAVVEIFGDQEAFMIDLALPPEPAPDDWIPTVKRNEIEAVMDKEGIWRKLK